jgi:hypothetical protein
VAAGTESDVLLSDKVTRDNGRAGAGVYLVTRDLVTVRSSC